MTHQPDLYQMPDDGRMGFRVVLLQATVGYLVALAPRLRHPHPALRPPARLPPEPHPGPPAAARRRSPPRSSPPPPPSPSSPSPPSSSGRAPPCRRSPPPGCRRASPSGLSTPPPASPGGPGPTATSPSTSRSSAPASPSSPRPPPSASSPGPPSSSAPPAACASSPTSTARRAGRAPPTSAPRASSPPGRGLLLGLWPTARGAPLPAPRRARARLRLRPDPLGQGRRPRRPQPPHLAGERHRARHQGRELGALGRLALRGPGQPSACASTPPTPPAPRRPTTRWPRSAAGDLEVRDAQTVADILVDPDGDRIRDHWDRTAHELLTGAHPARPLRRPRPDAARLRPLPDRAHPHGRGRARGDAHLRARPPASAAAGSSPATGRPTRLHPVVAAAARALLDKSDNERSGVISTALSFLSLYRDPVVAANTGRSAFRIRDLMNHRAAGEPLPDRALLRPLAHPAAGADAPEPDLPAPDRDPALRGRPARAPLPPAASS